MNKYENIRYGYGGWSATTFGYDSESDDVPAEDAIKTLGDIAAHYRLQAAKYQHMLEIAKSYDVPAVWKRWTKYWWAKNNVNTLAQVLTGINCGLNGKALLERGSDALHKDLEQAISELHPDDQMVAGVMGWS